jgi:hypothetical protein
MTCASLRSLIDNLVVTPVILRIPCAVICLSLITRIVSTLSQQWGQPRPCSERRWQADQRKTRSKTAPKWGVIAQVPNLDPDQPATSWRAESCDLIRPPEILSEPLSFWFIARAFGRITRQPGHRC